MTPAAKFPLQLAAVAAVLLGQFFPSRVVADGVGSFLADSCLDCHDAETRKGDLDLTVFSKGFEASADIAAWADIHDRVAEGEMPPKKSKSQPAPEARARFLKELDARLVSVGRERQRVEGRSRLRRLNRIEYETALSDLLGRPLRIAELLPADARKDGFTTVGEALTLSATQMETYLETLDRVFDEATESLPKPVTRTWHLSYKQTHGILQQYRREGPHVPVADGVAMFGTELFAHFDATLEQFTIPREGRYRVRVRARTMQSGEPITLTVRAGGTSRKETNHVPRWELTHQSIHPGEPQTIEWEGWLLRGHFLHVYPGSLPKMRFVDGEQNRQSEYEGPGVVVQWVEVEGPILESWPPRAHELLWGDTRLEPISGAATNLNVNAHLDGPPNLITRPWTVWDEEKQEWTQKKPKRSEAEMAYKRVKIPPPLIPQLRLAADDPKPRSTRLLTRFIPLAFRRDVKPAEIARFIAEAHRWIDEGAGFEESMRAAYKLALTSPGFLYHYSSLPAGSDATGRLTDEALAERLAFFLWNSIPDDRLRQLALGGRLRDAKTLHAEVERMLGDPKSDRFVNDFLDQWLDLRLIDFTAPDSDLYPEFDRLLRWSMLEETRGFFRELLDKDLSASNIVDSDFAMLNDRLAKQYGIKGVRGFRLRRVELGPQSARGGLMTQGSVLKVTANGSTSSPVVRGAWAMDRIVGRPADPPPPGAPAIEPDIRGAATIRQQLEKHRADPKCAGCHAQFDPLGIALEAFDVIGGQRSHYRILNPDQQNTIVRYFSHRPSVIKYLRGLPVETAYRLADGRDFADIRDLKELLLSDTEGIARNLVRRLIVYSTGGSLTYADRATLDEILAKTRAQDYGLRSLVHEVVASELFQMK